MISMGWRGLFEILAIVTAGCALIIYLVVPEGPTVTPVAGEPATNGLRTIYADPRFWRLAPLSATCIGTAWALQGLWAAPWLSDVEGLDRAGLLRYLFVMAIALSVGALLLGVTVDRLGRRGVGHGVRWSCLVVTVFITAQLALILRLPVALVYPVGRRRGGRCHDRSQLRDPGRVFPEGVAGRANVALNVFHIGGAFVVQYVTG